MNVSTEVVVILLAALSVLLQASMVVLLLRLHGSVFRRKRRKESGEWVLPLAEADGDNGRREDTGLHQVKGVVVKLDEMLKAQADPETHLQ